MLISHCQPLGYEDCLIKLKKVFPESCSTEGCYTWHTAVLFKMSFFWTFFKVINKKLFYKKEHDWIEKNVDILF